MKGQVIRYMRLFFPILFTLYLGSIISFTHVHIENGITIVHSHPYKKATDGTTAHHHTGSELQLLSQISTIYITGTFGLLLLGALLLSALRILQGKPENAICCHSIKRTRQLRAPPVC